MKDCFKGIIKEIVSDCTTSGVGGNEITAWIANRLELGYELDETNPSKIVDLSLEGEVGSGARLFTITGVKKLLNSGFDRIVADNRPDKFGQYFNFHGFQFKAADVENLDSLGDLVIIVESKDKADDGDGVFRVFGLEYGLFPSTDTMRANDDDGVRNLELTSMEGVGERFSNYTLLKTDYPTTKSLLIGLETPL